MSLPSLLVDFHPASGSEVPGSNSSETCRHECHACAVPDDCGVFQMHSPEVGTMCRRKVSGGLEGPTAFHNKSAIETYCSSRPEVRWQSLSNNRQFSV